MSDFCGRKLAKKRYDRKQEEYEGEERAHSCARESK